MTKYYLALILTFALCESRIASAQDLVIYEFAHPADELTAKFVQLLNTSTSPLDVGGYQLKTYFNGGSVLKRNSRFTFPTGTVIAPGGLYTISLLKEKFFDTFACYADNTSVSVVSDGNEVYELCNSSGTVIDRYGIIGGDSNGGAWNFNKSVVRRLTRVPNYGLFNTADFKITAPGYVADASPCKDTPDPLPVTLLSFSGRLGPGRILLDWSTAQEIDNDYFAVEHSDDSIEYAEVARVAAGRPEGQAYDYTYLAPAVGVHYFRLRQVDLDGAFEYSPTVALQLSEKATAGMQVDALGSRFTFFPGEAQTFRVISSEGKVVVELQAQAGQAELALPNLRPGVYVLTGKSASLRFVKP